MSKGLNMQKRAVEPEVAISSKGLVRQLNQIGQVYSADYVRRVERAAEQRADLQYQHHLETAIVPYMTAANELMTRLALVDSHTAYISNPNARSSAKNALRGADDELAAAYLAYTRYSPIEDMPGNDLIALHVHTRIEAIQKFITGRDNGEALCAVVEKMGGTYQRELLKANMPNLHSLPGAKPGYRTWRIDLANQWNAVKRDYPDFDAQQIMSRLIEKYGVYDPVRRAYTAKSESTDNEIKIFDSLIKGKNEPARYARKLLKEFEGA